MKRRLFEALKGRKLSDETKRKISIGRKGKGMGNKNGLWLGDDICPICRRDNVKLVYDHCHKTNEFRGYICFACNAALGMINDDVEILKNLILYLDGQ